MIDEAAEQLSKIDARLAEIDAARVQRQARGSPDDDQCATQWAREAAHLHNERLKWAFAARTGRLPIAIER